MTSKLSIKSFETLFKENYYFLVLTSFQIVKDKDTAKDVVQDFFINYWEKREHSEILNFKSYASRAVKNLSISYLRRKETENKRNDSFSIELQETMLVDEQTIKDELDIQLKKEQELHQLIERLPKKRKEIFLAFVKDDLSYEEIAKKYGISINTVKTQMQRSYTFIKTHIKGNSLNILLFYILISAS